MKIKIIIALLTILYLITLNEGPNKKINETNIGDYLTIEGNVSTQLILERTTIINLTDNTGSIKTIFFDKINIPGKEVKITGRIKEYQGEKELIGVKIKSLN